MLFKITYIDQSLVEHVIQVDLQNDDLDIVEDFFNNLLGYYPNSVILEKI
jgi:hypothetical protein